ncbi:recombinase family protein [Nocardia sp. NPDC057227]|uniref:recombinase family protein n=1 Tax=Nocardia sp. NPDC057227 TaxID=3346056 RepID=UPI00363B3D6E
MTLRAVIYARVSKPGEKSVNDQEKVGRRDLAEIGAEVVAVFTDKQSASRYRRVELRPGFVKTQEFIRSGEADLLWSFAANRAHRDLDDYILLRRLCIETGTLWRYGRRTYDLSVAADRRATNADAVRAEEFGDDLSEAVLRGMREAREDGRAHGKLHRGYRIVRDATSGRPIRREAIPEQAAVIREAARRALQRESMYSITRDLEQRWRAAGGEGLWTPEQVRNLLVSPTIAALRTHEGKVIRDGKWEAIISVDDHEKLHAMLTDPSRRTHRGSDPAYWLSYIAVCGVCGKPLSPKKELPRRPKSVPQYRCITGHVSRAVDLVDSVVEPALLRLLGTREAQAKLSIPAEGAGPSLEDSLAEKARLQDGLLEWVREAARNGISAALVKAYEAEVNSKIAEIDARVRAGAADPLLADLAGPGVEGRWELMGLLDRREVARAIVRVVVQPVRWTKEPVGVEIYPAGVFE